MSTLADAVRAALRLFARGNASPVVTRAASRLRSVAASVEAKAVTPQEVNERGGKQGRPVFPDVDYQKVVDDALKKSVWVYRCTTLVALATGSVPLKAQRQNPDGTWEDALDSELQKLIGKPNEQWSLGTFMRYTSYFLDLGGETFITKVRTNPSFGESATVLGAGIPIAIWAHRSDTFDPVPGKPGEPFIREYRLRGRTQGSEPPSEVIHILQPDPEDVYRGLAAMVPGEAAVEGDVAAQAWQLGSFESRGVPSGILTVTGGITDTQWEDTFKKFQKRYAMATRARGPMLLSDDVKWQQLALSAVESDYIGTRQMNRIEICALFGVPPMLVGIMEFSTLNNFQTAELVFWLLKMIPRINHIVEELNTHLAVEFEIVDGGPMRLVADTSKVPALWPLFEQRQAVALTWIDRGVSWQVANERFDLGLRDFPGWDNGLVAANKIPLDSLGSSGDIDP